MRNLALLSVLVFAQAVPALAFSRHKPSTLCQMIVSSDYTQEQINKKIEDAGDLKNATCFDVDYPQQKIPIVFYAIARGISNEDYDMDGNSATVTTIEELVQHGADVNEMDGQSSCSIDLHLSLNQPDLAVFLLQNGAIPCDETFEKELASYGTSASLPVLTALIDAGAGKPDLVLNTLYSTDDASWLAAAQALTAKYPGATLFDENAAYDLLTLSEYFNGDQYYDVAGAFPGKLAWLIARGLRFDVVMPGQTLNAFDYLISKANQDNMTALATIATAAKLTVSSGDLTIAAASGEAIFNYVLANLPLDQSLTGKSNTALNVAIANSFSLATIQQLLAAKPDLSIEASTEPTTSLALAAKSSTPDVVQALITAGANITQISSIDHQTAFMAAIAGNHEANAILLLNASQSVINQQNKEGLSTLMLAAQVSNDNLVAMVSGVSGVDIEEKDATGNTALFYAIDSRGESSVLELLSHGACVKVVNSADQTPLDRCKADNVYGYDSVMTAITNDLQTYLNQPNHC